MCLNFINVGVTKHSEAGHMLSFRDRSSFASLKGVSCVVSMPDLSVVGPPASRCPIPTRPRSFSSQQGLLVPRSVCTHRLLFLLDLSFSKSSCCCFSDCCELRRCLVALALHFCVLFSLLRLCFAKRKHKI